MRIERWMVLSTGTIHIRLKGSFGHFLCGKSVDPSNLRRTTIKLGVCGSCKAALKALETR